MRGRVRIVAAFGVALAIVACGLGVTGIAPPGTDSGTEESGADDHAVPPNNDGSSLPIDGAGPEDSRADAIEDAGRDAIPDVVTGVDACVPECNQGCGPTGATCSMLFTAPKNGITCPPGLDCRIECSSSAQICTGTITCPAGHACTVVCKGSGQSCNAPTIAKNGATSLCLECSGGAGSQSCNSVSTSSNACTTYCNPSSACNGTGGCMTVVNNAGSCP